MEIFQSIIKNFRIPGFLAKFVIYSIGLFIILGIPTALFPNPIIPYTRMIPSNILDYVFLFTTSVLAGFYFALPKSNACNPNKSAFGGGIFGFLAFACPTCIQLLVLLFGYAFLFNILNPLRPIIGLLSIGFLLFAISKKIL